MPEKVQVRAALYQAIDEEMARDERVFVIGEEVAQYEGAYKVTRDLYQKHNTPERCRVIDTPISEYGFAGIGVGAAMAGLRPIVEFMTFNFAMQAIDHIVNSAAKTHYMSGGQISTPIVFRGPNGAAARVGAQHSQCYAAWYSHIPGLKVVAPYFAQDAKGLLKSAIRYNGPVVFLEHELAYGHSHEVTDEFFDKDFMVEIGKARVVRKGVDVTIVSFSLALTVAIEAAQILENRGINAEVIDLRTIRPLDVDTIVASVCKTNRLLIIEGGWGSSGIAAEVAQRVTEEAFDYLDAPIARVCAADVPLPYAQNLETLALPSVDKAIKALELLLYKNR